MRVGLVLRHLLAVLLLPGMVVGAVPAWIRIALRAGDSRWPVDCWLTSLARAVSAVLLVGGGVLVIWSVSLFARVGLGTLAVAVGEAPETVEDVYEPFLLQCGLLERTPRGRIATPAGFAHVGLHAPDAGPNLFG